MARTLLALGRAQRRARRKAHARATLERALAIFDELGSKLWAEQARRELDQIGGRPSQTGALTETEARHSPLQAVLASALGGREATPRIHATDCRWDDVVLLCTDGLTRHVQDSEIEAELLAIRSAQEACHRLVQIALDRGGEDNVTVVIGRLKNKPPGL